MQINGCVHAMTFHTFNVSAFAWCICKKFNPWWLWSVTCNKSSLGEDS